MGVRGMCRADLQAAAAGVGMRAGAHDSLLRFVWDRAETIQEASAFIKGKIAAAPGQAAPCFSLRDNVV